MRGFEKRPVPSLTPVTRFLLGSLGILLGTLNLLALHSHLVYDQAGWDWRSLFGLMTFLSVGFALWRVTTSTPKAFGETMLALSLSYGLIQMTWVRGPILIGTSAPRPDSDSPFFLVGGALILTALLIGVVAVLIGRDATNESGNG